MVMNPIVIWIDLTAHLWYKTSFDLIYSITHEIWIPYNCHRRDGE